MRFSTIERSKIFTGYAFINEYCPSERHIIDIGNIDMNPLHADGKLFLTPSSDILFMWIRYSSFSIDIKINLWIGNLFDSELSYFSEIEHFAPMSSC